MAKNIVIQEGGVAKQLTVDKLKTNLVGGSSCLWVPEDNINLGTKSISENGTFRASDDGYLGYSEVTVSGVGTATGRDGDGDEAIAYPDPDTGILTVKKVPSRIEVITPPSNPYGIYRDGQAINKNGMVVKAYFESGGEYGTVSNGEITLTPNIAEYDGKTDVQELVGDGINVNAYTGSLQYRKNNQIRTVYMGTWGSNAPVPPEEKNPDFSYPLVLSSSSNVLLRVFLTKYNGDLYACAESGFYGVLGVANGAGSTLSIPLGVNVLHKIALSSSSEAGTILGMAGTSTKDPSGINVNDLTETSMRGSRQTITVSWPRPGDGKVLETTFEILVAPPYSTEE